VVPSQLIELGQQALTDVRIGVANGEPLVRCQLLASEFYEALKRALRAPELSPVERWAVIVHKGSGADRKRDHYAFGKRNTRPLQMLLGRELCARGAGPSRSGLTGLGNSPCRGPALAAARLMSCWLSFFRGFQPQAKQIAPAEGVTPPAEVHACPKRVVQGAECTVTAACLQG